ncbi:uncharacterized protein [Haliotis asinina]|uniref:uncharacterized protein n=1 Tax=Haliotis asinina TaxID=109174 RepID=UPI003531E5A9
MSLTGSTSNRMWTTLCFVAGLLLCVGAAKLPSTTTTTTTTKPTLTPLSLEDLFRIMFHRDDLNNDGVQTLSEFEQLWRQADLNGDGSITLTEYSTTLHFTRFVSREVYKYLDHDHNGVISMQEVPRLFTEFDTNYDGWITEQEFVDETFRMYNFVKKDIGPDKK